MRHAKPPGRHETQCPSTQEKAKTQHTNKFAASLITVKCFKFQAADQNIQETHSVPCQIKLIFMQPLSRQSA